MRRIVLALATSVGLCATAPAQQAFIHEAKGVLTPVIMKEGEWALKQSPETITSFHCPRSAGSIHDFYSEGDYWWPDPENPEGPYIQRDGMTNPNNFTAHREVLMRFSRIIGALASSYLITNDAKYVQHIQRHLEAWFLNKKTLMSPHLRYAQAIKGRVTGRGIGIIDTIHLMEVAQAVHVLSAAGKLDKVLVDGVKSWFQDYLVWLTTHPYGREELEANNNHGTCWVMQVATFSRLTGNDTLLAFCRERFKNVLLPRQMAADGSFPLELRRTKPYGYSLFNLDAMVMTCLILSTADDNLWSYETSDGKSIGKGMHFLFPFIRDKRSWPFAKDVMYWEEWPVAHPSLLFSSIALDKPEWFSTWKDLPHDHQVFEVLRNLPVRNPVIWF